MESETDWFHTKRIYFHSNVVLFDLSVRDNDFKNTFGFLVLSPLDTVNKTLNTFGTYQNLTLKI